MSRRLRFPSPAMVVAVIALFVSLGGTAVAAGVVPLAKRALVADNAKKVGGKTAPQLVSEGARQPGPASSAASLVVVKTAPFSLGPTAEQDVAAACDAGSRAVGGGYEIATGIVFFTFGNRPTSDGNGWSVHMVASSLGASGTVYAVCVK